MLEWAQVRALRADGLSQREIARRLGVNRRTVARLIESDEPPRYRRAAVGSQLDSFEPVLRRLLEEWPQIKAPRVTEILRCDYGYSGSLRLVQAQLPRLRPPPVRPAQRTGYRPGQVLQLDWADMPTRPKLADRERRVYALVASLPYSGAQTAFFSLEMTIESFLEGQPPRWRKPAAIAVVVAVALGAVIAAALVVRSGRGGEEAVAERLAAAGCTLKTHPEQAARHIASYDAKVKYNSFPPTSGTHHQQPVVWDAYPEPIVTVQEPHNLEHGGVVVHYGDEVAPATRDQLQAFYGESPKGMVLAPLPELGKRITLTAWTKLATCADFDENAFASFRGAYRGKGPERFRVGDLEPGT